MESCLLSQTRVKDQAGVYKCQILKPRGSAQASDGELQTRNMEQRQGIINIIDQSSVKEIEDCDGGHGLP